MQLNRRELLTLGAAASLALKVKAQSIADRDEWDTLRQTFNIDLNYIHMAGMLLASHPKPVRDAIERHRQALDRNPVGYYQNNGDSGVRAAAAGYFGINSSQVALTDSTTMGTALLYTGLKLFVGDEIVTTTHDHSVTERALNYAAERTGAVIKRVSLYDQSANASVSTILSRFSNALSEYTRVVAVTWVHSSTGVKLPIAEMGKIVENINQNRPKAERILFCVDGVHGFGIENVSMPDLRCDFFVAGTHKWLHGPRGTGILCARSWERLRVTIPSFSGTSDGELYTPGGFHSFEHRWALKEAFEFHLDVGKAKIEARIHALNTQMKEGLRKMSRVTIHTPLSPELSAGIICFSVSGYSPSGVVQALANRNIIASTSPYAVSYARVTPGLLNTPAEVDKTLSAIGNL